MAILKGLVTMTSASFCGSCGSVLKDGSLYCGSCGAAAPQSRVATAVPPPTMVGTVGGAPAALAQQPNGQAYVAEPVVYPSGPMGAPAQGLVVDRTIYATFGRRVGAYVIDAIPPILFYVIGYAALFAAILGRSSSGASMGLILLLGLPILYFVILWAMAAKGSSPGKALLGIRVVRENTGAFPGAGLGLGRLVLMGLLIGITLYIGGFSPLWDKSGRRKGWWDSAAGTVVLKLSAVQGYRTGVLGYTQAGPAATSLAVASLIGPSPDPASDSYQVEAPPGSWPAASTLPPPPPSSQTQALSDRPDWDLAPITAVATAMKVPAASWSDRPAEQVPPTPVPQPPAVPTMHSSTEQLSFPPTADDVPWGSPAGESSGVITAIPGLTPVGHNDSLEHTRMKPVRRPAAFGPAWELHFDDGRTVMLTGSLIIGRDPAPTAGESTENLMALGDEGRSVSKTHLRLDAGPGDIRVTDRHSTNGVTVITAGIPMACVPGVPTVVPVNSTVRFGDRHLVVRQA